MFRAQKVGASAGAQQRPAPATRGILAVRSAPRPQNLQMRIRHPDEASEHHTSDSDVTRQPSCFTTADHTLGQQREWPQPSPTNEHPANLPGSVPCHRLAYMSVTAASLPCAQPMSQAGIYVCDSGFAALSTAGVIHLVRTQTPSPLPLPR